MSAVTRAVALAVAAAVTLPVTGCGAIALLPGQGTGDTTPALTVEGTDGGGLDVLAARTVADMYTFLDGKLPGGATLPELRLVSYDSANPKGEKWCGDLVADDEANASYCHIPDETDHFVSWDRTLLGALREAGGDLGVELVLSHELGHAADRAQAPDSVLPVLVGEQRADCTAGSYTRDYATRNADVDMGKAMSVLFTLSDVIVDGGKPVPAAELDHGVGIERLFAFVTGWERGATACFSIGAPDTAERRDRVPVAASSTSERDMDWTPQSLGRVLGTVNTILGISPDRMAQVQFDRCTPDGRAVAVCPNGFIATTPDWLTKYQAVVAAETPHRTGDGTSLAALVNAVANGYLRDRGVNTEGDAAGLRAACVTGAVMQVMAHEDALLAVQLSAGDMDEALSEVLISGATAADIDGNIPEDVVSRSAAFITGIYNVVGPGACVTEFPDA